MAKSAMVSNSADSDNYVGGDETSLTKLIRPCGFGPTFQSVVSTLCSCDEENKDDLKSTLASYYNLLKQEKLTRTQITDFIFEFVTGSWKIEDKSAHARNLAIINLSLANRAFEEGSSEFAWEALSSAQYYSGFYEAERYTVESPTAQRSAKGGRRRAEEAKEASVLLSCLVKSQLIKSKPVRGWPNQADTIKIIANNIIPTIQEFGFPLPAQFDALCDLLHKLFERSESIKDAYSKNRRGGR